METAVCQLKDCKGYYPPPCYVSKTDVAISMKKYGIVICHWDMGLIEKGARIYNDEFSKVNRIIARD